MAIKSKPSELRKLLWRYRTDAGFLYEGLVLDLSTQVKRIIDKEGITKEELARRMGVRLSYLTRFFSGENVSLKSISKIFVALQMEPIITITGQKYHYEKNNRNISL